MFEKITDPEERGQIGIGTLIIFIAMVLVAAIAAGVLINTAGLLQSQADDTGTQTQEAVANQIEVVHASGAVENETHVNEVELVIKASAGANNIDLTSMTMQYSSSAVDVTYVHDQSEDATAGQPEFNTTAIVGPNDDSLSSTSDRISLTFNISDANDVDGLEAGQSAMLALTDQSGAQFTYGMTMPATFGDAEYVQF